MNNQKPYNYEEEQTWRNNVMGLLRDIKEQTQKTNGRVNKLENWRYYVTGAISFIVVIMIPTLVLLTEIIKIVWIKQ